MTPQQILQQLDRTGGVVYPDGQTAAVFSFAGIKDGRVWFHRGDIPHWGPAEASLEVFGDDSVGTKRDGKITFYMTAPGEAPEIPHGEVLTIVEAHREFMTRDQAIEMLGDPPTKDEEARPPATKPGKADRVDPPSVNPEG